MRNVSQPILKLWIQNHSQPMDINQGIHHLNSYVKNGESDDDNMLLQTLMKHCKAKSAKQTSGKKIKLG